MDSNNNAITVFAPLGERLHFFEIELHLSENNDHDVAVNQHDFYHIGMIDKIGREVNRQDAVEVYKIALDYLIRTNRVNDLLEDQKAKNKKIPAAKWKMWEAELYEYLHQLLAILDAREDTYQAKKEGIDSIVAAKLIQLPDKFKIKEMQLHFQPPFNHKTIALLIYYMAKAGIMPPYELGEFGKIAPIFGFHDKTIAKDFRELSLNSKQELNTVKSVIEILLDAVSKDLTKARKH